MPKYIDFDALGVQSCNPDVFVNKGYAEGWNSLMRILYDAPVVDAVPVVRCKECRYWEKVEYYPDGYKMCCRLLRAEMHGECFCSLGTRKDKEDAE